MRKRQSWRRFKVEGPGRLKATDNGDPTSFSPLQAPERAAVVLYPAQGRAATQAD